MKVLDKMKKKAKKLKMNNGSPRELTKQEIRKMKEEVKGED